MRTGLVGAGRLGTALACFLGDHGFRVHAVHSRSAASAHRAADKIGATVASAAELVAGCDRIIIATPDDQIAAVADELARHTVRPDAIVWHLSGALDASALEPLRARGCRTGSLHPLQTIPDADTGRRLLGRATFTIEGADDPELEQTLRAAGVPVVRIDAGHKASYHAAACLVSGYVDTLAALASGLLAEAGFTERQALDALLPLLGGAVDVLATRSPAEALTGPIARGDARTVARHLDVLTGEAEDVYRALGRATVALAAAGGTDPAALGPITTLLTSPKEFRR